MESSKTNKKLVEDGTIALQEMMDMLLGMTLFMEVTMNHGMEFINPEHPEFENKKNEVMDKIQKHLQADNGAQMAVEATCVRILTMMQRKMTESMETAEPSRIIAPGSLKLH